MLQVVTQGCLTLYSRETPMIKNFINRVARFCLRGICIEVEMTDQRDGKTKRIARYVGREAFHLMQLKAQQELRQMHQRALEEQLKASKN